MANQLSETNARELLEVAMEAATAAREATLAHFLSKDVAIDSKLAEGFDPVTAADHEAEVAIREVLQRRRPDDSIVGEELPPVAGQSGLTWIVDPIDGTRSFIIGVPLWTTLIGVHDGTRPIVGVVAQPYLEEMYWGIVGAEYREAGFTRRSESGTLRTRECTRFSDASIATTHRDAFADDADYCAFREIETKCRQSRHGGDAYHYAMLADGRIDLVIESGLQSYDVAALIPVIEGAGGKVTDWDGNDCSGGGRVLATGNATMHEMATSLLP